MKFPSNDRLMVTQKEMHQVAIDHGFYDGYTEQNPRSTPELLCLIHSEISEALEAYRHKTPIGEKGWIGEELADAVIRIFDLAEYLKIDIIKEVHKKHEINKKRPHMHGGKTC